MTGLEQMALSMMQKMTGLSAEEMQALANKAVELIQSIDTRLQNMEYAQQRIEEYLMPTAGDNPLAILEGTKLAILEGTKYEHGNDSNTKPVT